MVCRKMRYQNLGLVHKYTGFLVNGLKNSKQRVYSGQLLSYRKYSERDGKP